MRRKRFFSELVTFWRFLIQDILALFHTPEVPLFERLSLSKEGLGKFPFPEELEAILAIAQGYFGNPQAYPVNPYALILAIRSAERGRKGFEFGIVPVKGTDLQTQCQWACATVAKNFARFRESGEKDFIAFLGKRYAPVGAENDPGNLNQHWVQNVRYFYGLFSRGITASRNAFISKPQKQPDPETGSAPKRTRETPTDIHENIPTASGTSRDSLPARFFPSSFPYGQRTEKDPDPGAKTCQNDP